MPRRSPGPAAHSVPRLSEAPSSTTATSRTVLAPKAMPVCQPGAGTHRLRTSVPIRMARTRGSSQARPKTATSAASSSIAPAVTARQSPRPGTTVPETIRRSVAAAGWRSACGGRMDMVGSGLKPRPSHNPIIRSNRTSRWLCSLNEMNERVDETVPQDRHRKRDGFDEDRPRIVPDRGTSLARDGPAGLQGRQTRFSFESDPGQKDFSRQGRAIGPSGDAKRETA